MRQYNEIKKRYPGSILFFRMGDFYEMFGDDAIVASNDGTAGGAISALEAAVGEAAPAG